MCEVNEVLHLLCCRSVYLRTPGDLEKVAKSLMEIFV